jgi:hypothetical protein
MFFVLGMAAFMLLRCVSMVSCSPEFVFDQFPSPNGARKVLISAGDAGATGFSSFTSLEIVDAAAKSSSGGCRLLLAPTHEFTEGRKPIGVRWVDDAHLMLTYSSRIPVEQVATRCEGVAIEHLLTDDGPAGRDRGR